MRKRTKIILPIVAAVLVSAGIVGGILVGNSVKENREREELERPLQAYIDEKLDLYERENAE